MLRVEEALGVVATAAGAPRARPETVSLALALGRVLAEDVAMDHDVPPFHRATMDGFAIRSADATGPGAELEVTGRVLAGALADRAVGPGEAVAIMTGAPLPSGADAVVPVEETEAVEGALGRERRVRLRRPSAPGANVAHRAEQVAAGAVVAAAGTWVHAGTVGVLAAAGRVRVAVAAKPRVAIVGTGDEVVPADRVPGPAQIRDSNGHALAAQSARAGAVGVYAGPVRDDRDALRAAVDRGLSADVLCLSGGVSMGDKDLVPSVLEEAGVERLFHRWAVKPGGPMWVGRRGDTLVFGLPGNPAATFVGFELLVVPALHTRLGLPFRPRFTVRAAMSGPLPAPIGRRQYVPVDLGFAGPVLAARPLPWKGSGDLFALAAASGLAVVLEKDAPASPGGASHAVRSPGAGSAVGAATVDVVPLGTALGRFPS